MAVQEVNVEEFETAIRENKVVVAKYWAPWCGPCKMFAPSYEQVAEKHGEIAFLSINSDEHPSILAANGVRGLPTVQAWVNGELRLSRPGMMTQGDLEREIQELIG